MNGSNRMEMGPISDISTRVHNKLICTETTRHYKRIPSVFLLTNPNIGNISSIRWRERAKFAE